MKLSDLNPVFVGAGGEGISNADGSPVPARFGIGIILDCPCGKCTEYEQLFVPFANPLDGGPQTGSQGWQRTGTTFDDLTLTPSILRNKDKGGCGWHGYITAGEVITV